MKPIDVFDKLFGMAYFQVMHRSGRRPATVAKTVPGELLNLLSKEERKILQGLLSDDIGDIKKIPRHAIEMAVYPDSWSWQEYQAKIDFSKMKMEFDKKIK